MSVFLTYLFLKVAYFKYFHNGLFLNCLYRFRGKPFKLEFIKIDVTMDSYKSVRDVIWREVSFYYFLSVVLPFKSSK